MLVKKITCLTLLFILSCTTPASHNQPSGNNTTSEDILWYDAPPEDWNSALPLGNGRLGAMVFGHPGRERIQLNDDSMWPGEDAPWEEPAGTPEDLQRIRELLFAGENKEADRLFVEQFSNKTIVRSHQTLGDLFIDLGHDRITDYRRELNLSEGVVTVSYRTNGHAVTQKAFVSHPHRAIVIELTSEAPTGLQAKVELSRPEDDGRPTATTVTTVDNLLVMRGEVTQRKGKFDSKPAPLEHGVKFETQLRIDHQGGEVVREANHLKIEGALKATLYLVSNSSYYTEDVSASNAADLAALGNQDFAALRAEHVMDHRSLYDRVNFTLDAPAMDSLPTDQRVARVKESGAVDPGLQTLLFKFGRYLLIASSRPGTNPANLQGLWNPHIEAPWNADYHLNINLQMNYWPADMTNLAELNEPLFDYADRLIENGKQTARKNFGCGGSFIPHATDLWGPTWLRAPTAYWGCSLGAGGWLVQHYWQHYEFTNDTEFLRERALPAIEKVAQFYSDWLIEDPRDGTLISAPSTSPENRFVNDNGDKVASCLGSAMDQQVIFEVFTNYLRGCELLKVDTEFSRKVATQLERLRPGFVVGEEGRLLEWDRPYTETEPGHRHMSHLYGFHPGNNVTLTNNPEMVEAVKRTLDYRLENGGAGPGWSRAWLINCSARLQDGEMAFEHVQQLLARSTGGNLFNLHPPFQIDGNFGYTAGVTEMLLQSQEAGLVRLLPALPEAWPDGRITGLRARGGLTVDLDWKDGQLLASLITADGPHSVDLAYGDDRVAVNLAAGEEFRFVPGR
jgi:alpha-L-fucosidase 2